MFFLLIRLLYSVYTLLYSVYILLCSVLGLYKEMTYSIVHK